MAPSFQGLFGIADPRVVDAIRTVPGQEEIAALSGPQSQGPLVRTFIYSGNLSQTLIYFEREGEVWVRGSLTESRGSEYSDYDGPSEAPLEPDLSQRFLDWLRDCTPFLPNPIADL